jgi:hypothetical protein
VLLTFLLPILPIYVPAFNEIFRTEQPDVYELSLCLSASAIVYIGVEIEKFIGNNRKKSNCLHTNFGKTFSNQKVPGWPAGAPPTEAWFLSRRNYFNLVSCYNQTTDLLMLRPSLAKKSILALLATFSLIHRASAQDKFIEFGQVRHDEMMLKECSFDKSADAMILLDHAVAYFNDENNLITERRIRLKILKEKGVERGDIRIPFYSEGDFENIYNIEAVVFTPTANGDFEQKTLERKNIFTRQVNKLYSLVTFALPNVQVGSIIDYRYRSQMRSYGGLRSWEFQS